MSGIQNRRTRNTNKPVPGCLGRVVNFFDLSTGVAGNRLLTDKQHFDGFGHSRRQSDAMRISPIGDELDDEVVVSELTKNPSNRNTTRTSVKMLVAEEMSKEVELNHNSPNLVAKLMGLETLPQRKPNSVVKKGHSRSYSGSNIGTGLDSWQQEKRSLEHNRYKEFPDMTWQPQEGRCMRDKPSEKRRSFKASNEKKMALVRQKFVEAKSLAVDEKQWQSKKYQEALDVLSSNRCLFLKLLEEPNSFSQNHHYLQCSSPPPKSKRITVLRPSKILDDNQIPRSGKMNAKMSNKAHNTSQVNSLDKRNHGVSPPSSRLIENPTPSTRIVVLKPSDKSHNLKDMVSPSPLSQRENSEEMYETLSGHQKEETFSSLFSNGYSGDESSFHKSENEFTLGNLSDSEVVTPRSRLSWDYIHRFESPYGSSSFSHASCSPESSICKEAKKRLSERWSLMSSNGNCQEKKHSWRSSSTLSEMLALSDTKNAVRSEEKGIVEEQEMRESPLCPTSNLNIDQFVNDSPRNLLRSNSVPASFTVVSRVLDPKVGEAGISKEIAKTSTPKSSFKEKISNLFFSKNKRISKDKSLSSQSKNESEKPVSVLVQAPEKVREGTCKDSSVMKEEPSRILHGSPGNSSSQGHIDMERKPGVIYPEAKLCVTNPLVSQTLGKNQDQPSPVSVLEPPFEEDENVKKDSSNVEGDKYGSEPIESIARTLSWDDPCVDTATSHKLVSRGSEEEEAQGLLFFVKALLSTASFDSEVAPNSLFAGWHSPESPLDPSLRDNFIDMNAKDIVHEPTLRRMRSEVKLAFDCVNTALLEIISYKNALECSSSLLEEVWACVKEWFPCEIPEELLGDDVDSSSLIMEAMARKEVVDNVWTERARLERENVGMDIEAVLLEEIVQELVVDILVPV